MDNGGGSEEEVWVRRRYGDFENGGLERERGRRLTLSHEHGVATQHTLYSTEKL